jgi:protein-S-isoprenylcysteine O-methyltransferase Ste14
MWLWTRALAYMIVIGVGWLVFLPACLLYWEHAGNWTAVRAGPWSITGIILFVVGVALAMWSGCYLIGLGRGTPLPLDPPRRLVTNGPYRWVRNPQAIAMVLMVVGELLIVKSDWLWVMLPLTIIYLEAVVGPIEAKQLARDFGLEYENYAARVPKWIPNASATPHPDPPPRRGEGEER